MTAFSAASRRRPAAAGSARRVSWWVWAPSCAVAASLAVAIVIVVGQGGGGPRALAGGAAGVLDQKAASESASSAVAQHLDHCARAGGEAEGCAGTLQTYSANASHGSSGGGGSALGFRGTRARASSSVHSQRRPPPRRGHRRQHSRPRPQRTGRKVSRARACPSPRPRERVDRSPRRSSTSSGSRRGSSRTPRSRPTAAMAATPSSSSACRRGIWPRRWPRCPTFATPRSHPGRTTTQDVTNQFRVDQRRLADDRALRTALLKQLASAVTQVEIDSLNARIHDAAQAISSDESTINSSTGASATARSP